MKRYPLLMANGLSIAAGGALAQSADYKTEAMAVHQQMKTRMAMESSGDPDKDFASMMIPHHQGAIDMARLELKFGKDPELRAMAEKMITAQEKEIEELKAWQAKTK